MVNREGYNDIMQAYENQIGKYIIDQANRFNLKKIEAYMVLENVLDLLKQEIKNERKK